MGSAYEKDFYAWAHEQAALLRAGKLAEADVEHIAEEIESMGKAEKRELVARLTVLLLHLLKWRYQPNLQGASFRATIEVQRLDIADLLEDNPSLKSVLPEAVARAYRKAIKEAERETGFARDELSPRLLLELREGRGRRLLAGVTGMMSH